MPKLSRDLKRRLRLLATVLAIAALIFLLPARLTTPLRVVFTEAVGPAEEAVFQVGGDALSVSSTLSDAFFRQEEQKLLRTQVLELQNRIAMLEDLLILQQVRIDSMKGLMELKQFPFTALSVPVTAYESTALHESVTVAAGSRDGVTKGMAVCAAGALVGIVEHAWPWRSQVRLITDSSSVIPVRLVRSRRLCLLQGTGSDLMALQWVDRRTEVMAGDVAVTASAIQVGQKRQMYPEGLPAASVGEVSKDPFEPLFLKVTAAARVNLERLEAVEIIIPAPGRPAAQSASMSILPQVEQ